LIPRFIFIFDLNQVSCISTLTVDINVAPIIRILTSFKKDHLNAEVQIKTFSGNKTSKERWEIYRNNNNPSSKRIILKIQKDCCS
jgi:hypothetical protein